MYSRSSLICVSLIHCVVLVSFLLFCLSFFFFFIFFFLLVFFFFLFFFFFSSRRRHTSCLSDWSSDVCSSDLASPRGPRARRATGGGPTSSAAIGNAARATCASGSRSRSPTPRGKRPTTSPRPRSCAARARAARQDRKSGV